MSFVLLDNFIIKKEIDDLPIIILMRGVFFMQNKIIDKNYEKDVELLINKADIIIENTIRKIAYEIIFNVLAIR